MPLCWRRDAQTTISQPAYSASVRKNAGLLILWSEQCYTHADAGVGF